VEGTKAEADAKRAKRAKIVFIILDILIGLSVLTSCAEGRGGGCRELMVKKQTSARTEGGKTIFQFNLVQLGIWIIEALEWVWGTDSIVEMMK